jgi:Protein of unknown function (DUF2851)
MKEHFLHFLWQFQYFDRQDLSTTEGQGIQILKAGFANTNAGPDFMEARLLIDNVEWAGQVEIHIKASDWQAHKHQYDPAYDNVVLHVVWTEDIPIFRKDGTRLPTLVLHGRVDISLIHRYEQLVEGKGFIACQTQFGTSSSISKFAMLDNALMQRLNHKAQLVTDLWTNNNADWEETAYQLLAKNFGFKINSEAFLQLAQRLPLKIIQKHRDNLLQIEALLFGMAGFLNNELPKNDTYFEKLQKEYQFLEAKYQLKGKALHTHQWKFLRLRPANFSTVRLAQLARLLSQQSSLFSLFINSESLAQLITLLQIEQSAYWQQHYHFGKQSTKPSKTLGRQSAENLVMNTAVPLLVSYAQHKGQHELLDKAIGYLETLPAEKNHITEQWESLGMKVKTAFDSQALLEQHQHFCSNQQCLSCKIGVELVRQTPILAK